MAMATSTAILVAGAAAAAGSIYTAEQAKSSAKKARDIQQKELARQASIREQQDKLVAEQQAKETAATTERRARLSTGRKGLLYQGTETGVNNSNDKLGG